ncbi:MAG: HD domain-containing protein [Myxococcales bacterium]|nr:HD domain-containing protein [Myxococcales bacterium]
MTLAVPPDVVELCRKLRAGGFEAWVVGGAVRDLLRGAAAKDFDVATSAEPAEVTRIFGRKRTIPTGEKHGTVTVLTERAGQRQHVEVTTYRGEGAYSDGRRPDAVVFVRTLDEDLKRRDFTMNAIAYDPLGDTLVDPYGGQRDLSARVIRAVGDPLERFLEDGLRAMRAVRFAAQLEFAIDPATERAIADAIEVFRKVSAERVRDELVKILAAKKPSIGLERMRTTGLLAATIPELLEGVGMHQNRFHAHDVWQHTLAAVDATELGPGATGPPWLVRFAALLHDVAKPRTAAPKEDSPSENTFYRHEHVGAAMAEEICRRLKLANAERDTIVNLVGNHMFWYTPEWSDGTVRRFISRVGVEQLDALFALRAGDVRARGHAEEPGVEIDELKARVAEEIRKESALKITDLAVGGADVMELIGCKPGPIIGDVLRALLERVLDDASLNERDTLRALIPTVSKQP